MAPRWRLPSNAEQTTDWLCSTYRVIVARRHDIHPDRVALTEETKANIGKIATWLTDETERRWLLLRGRIGNGKTTAIQAIEAMIKHLYRDETQFAERVQVTTAKQIADLARDGYSERLEELQRERILAIDDLGIEPATTQNFGNYSAPVVELLYARHERKRLTILSTNLSNNELQDKYGLRFYDRLREVAKVVTFLSDSFRGKSENAQKCP